MTTYQYTLSNTKINEVYGSRDPNRLYYDEYFKKLPRPLEYLQGSSTFEPDNINDGANDTSNTITVTGAEIGDLVLLSADMDLEGLILQGYVTAVDTITINLVNNTGGAVNLAGPTTVTARVFKNTIYGLNNNVNSHLMLDGSFVSNGSVGRGTLVAGEPAGVTITTAGTINNQVVITPRTNTGSGWNSRFGTENQLHFATTLRIVSSIADVAVFAGLKLTLNSPNAFATDNNQAFFLYASDDSLGTLTNNGNLHFIYSISGTDYVTDLGLVVAADTNYRLRIEFDSERKVKIYVNDTQYGLTHTDNTTTPGGVTQSESTTASIALTDDIDLIPYVGVETLTNGAKVLNVLSEHISRVHQE